MVIFSTEPLPLKASVGAGLALERVEVVARIPDELVVAGAHQGEIVAVAAEDEVVARRSLERVGADPRRAARSLYLSGRDAAGIDHIVAAEAAEDQPVGRLLIGDVNERKQAERVVSARHRRYAERVGATGGVDGDLVELTITAAARGGEIDVDAGGFGAGQVNDAYVIRAAQRIVAHCLDVVEVHHDRADVAQEPGASADRIDGYVLAGIRAVEQQLVGIGLAFDGVAAVARIPLEDVVAGAEKGRVGALVAVDEIVAVAAEQQVGAVARFADCRCRLRRRW